MILETESSYFPNFICNLILSLFKIQFFHKENVSVFNTKFKILLKVANFPRIKKMKSGEKKNEEEEDSDLAMDEKPTIPILVVLGYLLKS